LAVCVATDPEGTPGFMWRGRAFPKGLVCLFTHPTHTHTHTHTHTPHTQAKKRILTRVKGRASWSSWGAAWALFPEARSAGSSGDGGGGGVLAPHTTRTEELERERERESGSVDSCEKLTTASAYKKQKKHSKNCERRRVEETTT